MKFMVTHAIKTTNRAHHFLWAKASLSPASSLPGSSHLIRTNPHIGSQLSVYSVHFLSSKSFFAFGGIPIPNSKTRIFVRRAVRKCHISWIKTTIVNIKSVRSIPIKIVIEKVLYICKKDFRSIWKSFWIAKKDYFASCSFICVNKWEIRSSSFL